MIVQTFKGNDQPHNDRPHKDDQRLALVSRDSKTQTPEWGVTIGQIDALRKGDDRWFLFRMLRFVKKKTERREVFAHLGLSDHSKIKDTSMNLQVCLIPIG